MNFEISDEQKAFADLAAQILSEAASHEKLRKLEASDKPRFDPVLWKELSRSGLLGISIPEEFGGADQSFFELSLLVEQIGRFTAPVPVIETLVLAALPILRFGSPAQRTQWLTRIVDGELIATAAIIEDQADPLRPMTRVEVSGDGYILNGEKVCVPAGAIAELFLVPASFPDGRIGVFALSRDQTGLDIESVATTSGQPEAHMRLESVNVPESAQLGSGDNGAQILDCIRSHGTAAYCSLAVGVCAEALRLTAEYSKQRKQFGQPIATFQAVGQRQADAYVDTEAIRLTAWQAAWQLGSGLNAEEAVAVAKYWAALAGQRVVHTAAHLHGGMGVDRDYPLHRYFLYAKQLELSLGGSQQQLRTLGRMLAEGTA
ncbi:MAG: acyl-CoA dehydrogenase [Deltaproteobacteria bacterium]|nr:acyl-CoA dehydrogenase [Deltaproteobacteria bacterium]